MVLDKPNSWDDIGNTSFSQCPYTLSMTEKSLTLSYTLRNWRNMHEHAQFNQMHLHIDIVCFNPVTKHKMALELWCDKKLHCSFSIKYSLWLTLGPVPMFKSKPMTLRVGYVTRDSVFPKCLAGPTCWINGSRRHLSCGQKTPFVASWYMWKTNNRGTNNKTSSME